jgi:hypothetical protein
MIKHGWMFLGLMLGMTGCVAEVAPDDGEPTASAEEALSKGASTAETTTLPLATGTVGRIAVSPKRRCYDDCYARWVGCENHNANLISNDPDELMDPCDLDYSICASKCDRIYPQ